MQHVSVPIRVWYVPYDYRICDTLQRAYAFVGTATESAVVVARTCNSAGYPASGIDPVMLVRSGESCTSTVRGVQTHRHT